MRKIRIGKRNIKTAISVFLAISLYLILLLIDRSNNLEADGFSGLSGMYTPFFAGIAAAYTSHKDYKSSLKQAQIRSLGSVVGGYFGMIIILLVELLFKNIFTIDDFVFYKFLEYLFVSLGIIILIYIIVVTKQKDATFISCLTYLSVTISIRNGGMPIPQFATNRILSTLIGVGIALLVNNFKLNYKKNKNVLFLASYDNVINYEDYQLSFTKYKINDLYQRGAKLILNTKRHTLDSMIFDGVKINKPVVLMDGFCTYDHKKYIYQAPFEKGLKDKINYYLVLNNYDVFTYVVHDDKMVCHYLNLDSDASKVFYKVEEYNNIYPFVYAPVLEAHSVAMYEVILKIEQLDKFLLDLEELKIISDVVIRTRLLPDANYIMVRILPTNCSRADFIMKLSCYNESDFKVAFVNNINDLKIAQLADFSICFNSCDEGIKNLCDYVVESNDFNDVLRLFNKIYFAKDLEKYLNKLRGKKNGSN